MHPLLGARVLESQSEGVEELSLQSMLCKPAVHSALAIEIIPDDRMMDGRQMDTDLMHASGDDLHLEQTVSIVKCFDHFEMRE